MPDDRSQENSREISREKGKSEKHAKPASNLISCNGTRVACQVATNPAGKLRVISTTSTLEDGAHEIKKEKAGQ
jgi:hypothetical protein